MEEKIIGWIARDKNGTLFLYIGSQPYKDNKNKVWLIQDSDTKVYVRAISNDNYPYVKWEDKEPTKVELTIKICEQL